MTNTYKVHLSDGQKLKHPSHSDLVSNLTIFNEEYDSKRLSDIEKILFSLISMVFISGDLLLHDIKVNTPIR